MTKKKPITNQEEVKQILSDGEWHARRDLLAIVGCKTAKVLQIHIVMIRKDLSKGEMILCELVGRTIGYRWVSRKG